MDLFKMFAVDPQRITAGAWHVFTDTTDEIVQEAEIGDRAAVLLASIDNPAYEHALMQKIRGVKTRKGGGEISQEEDNRLTGELVAAHIVLDWRNWVLGEPPKEIPIPYSKDKVLEIWTSLQWVKLRRKLSAMSGNDDAYRAIQQEAVLKN